MSYVPNLSTLQTGAILSTWRLGPPAPAPPPLASLSTAETQNSRPIPMPALTKQPEPELPPFTFTSSWRRLDDLPPEVMLNIFELLGKKDLVSFRGVCKYFRDTASPTVFRKFKLRLETSDLGRLHAWYPSEGYTYCREHGHYDGDNKSKPACKPAGRPRKNEAPVAKENCGYHTSNVAAVEREYGVKMDPISANLKTIIKEYGDKAPFYYAQELYMTVMMSWETHEISATHANHMTESLASYVLPHMIRSMPNLRTVKVLAHPFGYTYADRPSPFVKYFLPALCRLCEERNLDLHLNLKCIAANAYPAFCLKNISGISSLSMFCWRAQMGNNFVGEVAKVIERSPKLKLEKGQARSKVRMVKSLMGHAMWVCQMGQPQYGWIVANEGKESGFLEGLSRS